MLLHDAPVSAPRARVRRSLGGPLVVGATVVTTGVNYLFQLLLGRWMGPEEFGRWSVAFGVATLVALASTALQTAVARSEAVRPIDTGRPRPLGAVVTDPVVRAVVAGASVVAAAVLAASPLLRSLFGLDPVTVAGVAALIPGTILSAAAFGFLQGNRRFLALAGATLVLAVGKLVVGTAALALGRGTATILTVLGVYSLVVALGALWWGARRRTTNVAGVGRDGCRALAASVVLGALTVGDLPLARYWLDPADAGRYAAAATTARAVLILPALLAAVVFPDLARPGRGGDARQRRLLTRAAVLTAAVAVAGVVTLAVVAPVALPTLLGDAYRGTDALVWQLGLASVPLAVAGLLVQFLLAGRGAGWLVWLPVAPLVQVVWLTLDHDGPGALVRSGLAAGTVLVAVTAGAVVRDARRG
jgi:O-antigen/teichoic acid export membrane protein